MKALLRRLVREESGQDLIEYALLAAFIALAAISSIQALTGGITGVYDRVVTALAPAGGS